MTHHSKNSIGLREIINVNFGILGVEFCWALFTPNMSPILLFLGARPSSLAHLWILPPLIALVSPFIGHISDLTVTQYGKRRPYIFVGLFGIFLMCIITPFIKSLWILACVIIFLVAFLNIVHQPMRALVADVIPKHQLTRGFSVHLTFAGLGAVMGSAMPLLFRETSLTVPGTYQPSFLSLSFFVAGVLALLTGLFTCAKTKENITEKSAIALSLSSIFKSIFTHFLEMPKILRLISVVQFLIWTSYFLVFAYYALSIAETIFGLPPDADVLNSPKHKELMKSATVYSNICFIYFQLSSCLISFIIPVITKWISRKTFLSIILLFGGIGILSLSIDAKTYYIPALIVLGMGYASSIGIHFSMLAANLPKTQTGLNTGVVNVATCLSQIVAGLCAGLIIKYLTQQAVTPIIAYSGVFLIIGAVCNQFIQDKERQL